MSSGTDDQCVEKIKECLSIRNALVFAENDFIQKLRDADIKVFEVSTETSHEQLRELTTHFERDSFDVDSVIQYACLVTSTQECMRSFDYRSPNEGINLFVRKAFTNKRELQQGLGRVGR